MATYITTRSLTAGQSGRFRPLGPLNLRPVYTQQTLTPALAQAVQRAAVAAAKRRGAVVTRLDRATYRLVESQGDGTYSTTILAIRPVA
jgi:hypothetical protein